jgi:para-nitrobenzyl esterase
MKSTIARVTILHRSSVALALGSVAALTGAPAVAAGEAPVARIASGAVSGVSEGGVASWKGIPFAAPPVGALRWRAPQPVTAWKGARAATAYAADCMQEPFGGDAAPLGTPPAEDCLYANVWKPAGAKGKLPVIFWIYGGGFVNGGSSPPTYSGAPLARQGVVVVSFNYRVGRFGTFAHPALTRADADHGLLVNYGYLDQIAALKWVRANIAAFGGDADNVTVMGESAGGGSVHNLMTSPLSRGLFARAIVMSGGDGRGMLGGDTMPGAEETGAAFGESKGVPRDDPQALAKLRALSSAQVTDKLNLVALFQGGKRTFSSPFPDGRISVDALAAYRSGTFNKVPIMIGATSADLGGEKGPMVAGARDLAGLLTDQQAPVYYYRFSYVAQAIAKPGAEHASDVPYFFDTQAIRYGAATTPRDNAMGAAISAYVVNFAWSGDPRGRGLPAWSRYSRAADMLMDFAIDGKPGEGRDPLAGAAR